MQQRPIRQPLDRRDTIELNTVDRAALEGLYYSALSTVERCEKLLGLPPSRPTRAERRRARAE